MRRAVRMWAATRDVLLSLAALAVLLEPAHAADEIPIGPRAIAMGSASTAIADDASSIFWNPAGLPDVGNQEIAATHADLFGSGIKNDLVAFVLPFSSAYALATDWFHSGFDDGELGYGDNRFDLATGFRLRKGVSLGVNAKYLSRDTQLDQISIRQGSGAGLDAGLLYVPFDRLRLGADLQDMFDSRLHYTGGNGTSVVYRRSLRVGAALRPFRSGLLAVDVDDRLHVGAEVAPLPIVALRAGFEKDLAATGEDPTYGMGIGVKSGIFHFDYALSLHPTLGPTSHFGMAMDFNFNPSQVRIEKVETHEIYASLEKDYARNPVGTVRVRNLQDRPLATQLSVFAPDLMDQPTEQEVVLRPRTTQEVPLTMVLSDKVIERSGDRRVPVQVEFSYRSERLPRHEKRTAQLVAYGPGAIRWGGGVAQAAAYVTSTDPVVADFARQACWPVALHDRNDLGPRNVALTAAVFDALGALGVAYVPDPVSPFETVSQAAGAVDNVQYPRQTLARKAGDCDDTSVLLAALLENVGVSTRLVDVPGHLFLLAGTGVHERNRLALGIDDGLYVVEDRQLWIPIETTAIAAGFAEAWKQGAEAYANWAARGRIATFGVEESQARYEPAALPDPAEHAVAAIDSSMQARQLDRDAATVTAWRKEFMSSRYGAVDSALAASPEALNEVAHAYFEGGALGDARALLERARASDPLAARTHNNLADILASQGELDRAAEEYVTALGADSTDAGIWLNLGLLRDASGDTLGSQAPLARGLALSGGYTAACGLLGIAIEPGETREGRMRMTAEEARDLLRAALRNVPATARDTSTSAARKKTRTPRPWILRTAGPRSGSESTLSFQQHLYWKD